MRTSELTGAALDWAVAKCEGRKEPELLQNFKTAWFTWGNVHYCTSWAIGGPIIEREEIAVCFNPEWEVPNWGAWRTDTDDRQEIMGETPLVAAMRCYVASKLGDNVDIPEELK